MSKYKTAAERRHMQRVAEIGCLICGGPATLHHVTSDGYKRIARSHQRVVPLCPKHHMIQFDSRESIEALGHKRFCDKHHIDILLESDKLWSESCGMA
jgi:hypothetical protein